MSKSPVRSASSSDKKKSKMSNAARMASGGPIGGAIMPPVPALTNPNPTNADLAAMMASNLQQNMAAMTSMEGRLETRLTATNEEVKLLKERVIHGEATLDDKIDRAVGKAVSYTHLTLPTIYSV